MCISFCGVQPFVPYGRIAQSKKGLTMAHVVLSSAGGLSSAYPADSVRDSDVDL